MPSDADSAAIPGWNELEQTVRRLLDDHDALRQRAAAAEKRAGELERALHDVSGGRIDPMALAERARALEHENRELHTRLDHARETVQRLLARVRFSEEES